MNWGVRIGEPRSASEVFGLRGSKSAIRNPKSAISLALFSAVLASPFSANAATLEICEQELQISDSTFPNPQSAIRNPQSEIRNPKSTQRITGRVEDESGAALPRALVEAHDPKGKVLAKTRTNSRGEFVLDLPEGSYTVDVELAGFAPLKDQALEVTQSTPPLRLPLEIPSIQQQIVVTATNTEAPLPQVGSSVTVLTGDQLLRDGVATVGEALRRVPGLALVRSGGAGQLTSLFVRGGESDYTKVLIDGIVVNDPGGSYNFANLTASNIDRIEVIRGPQSALFGSDAIAGVVQIFTKRGTSEGLSPKPTVLVEGGTFATLRYGGGIEGKGERADYSAAFTRLDTDNNVSNGSFNQTTFTGNFGFVPFRKTELRAIFRAENGRTGVPGAWAFHRPDPDEYFHRRDLAGGVLFTHFATMLWTQKVSYTVSDSRQLSVDPADSGSFVPEFQGRRATETAFDFPFQFLNQTRRQRVNYQSDVTLPSGHLLTAGAEYERESGTIGDPSFEPLSALRNNCGAYVQDQWALYNRFFATVGVRLEHNGNFGFFAAPRASVALHVHEASGRSFWGLTKIKGNFGLGIKEPTLVESFSESPFFRGNPDLLPEKSNSWDAGIEQGFGGGRSVLEITWFDNRFRNQIGFATTNFTTFEGTFFNIGKTRARGVETILKTDLPRRWEISGGYTFLSSRVLESTSPLDPAFAKGQELFRRPRHSGYAELRWKPGSWTFGATGIAVGRRVDGDFSGLGMTRNPGYAIVNLLASYRLSELSSFFALVENAFDKEYMEVLGFPALRRHFRIGLRFGL